MTAALHCFAVCLSMGLSAPGAGDAAMARLAELVAAGEDVTACLQEILDAAGETGGVVELPPGTYRMAGSVRIPEGVTLEGSWRDTVHYITMDANTVFLLTGGRGDEDGEPAFTLTSSSGIKGLTIAHPEQTFPDVVPYPWAIRANGIATHVENITFINAYQGLQLGPNQSSLHYVKNVYGCVLRRGLYVDASFDIGRIESVHFNEHYFSRVDLPGAPKEGLPNKDQVVANYTRSNLEAFIIARDEWGSIRDTFVYGAKVGYRFITTEHGSFNGKLSGIGADGCMVCLQIEQTNPYGMLISDGQFVAHPYLKPIETFEYDFSSGEEVVQIVTAPDSDTPVVLSNCSFWGVSHHAARLSGAGTVSFSQCIFRGWDGEKEGRAAIHAEAGKVSATYCQFLEWPGQRLNAIRLDEGVERAKVIGNMGTSGVRIDNAIGDRAAIAHNDPPQDDAATEAAAAP